MDESRFDCLTKAFVAAVDSRRGVLQIASASIGGGLLGVLGLYNGQAKGKKKKKCPSGTTKCGVKRKKNGKKKFKCCPTTCSSQSTCGPNCKCFFDVNDALACYDLTQQTTCCDSNVECGAGAGCVKGACGGGGTEAGRCFALCES